MSRTQRTAAIVALAGLLVGLVGAVAIPRTTRAQTQEPRRGEARPATTTPPAFARLAEPLTRQPRRDPAAGKPPEERGAQLAVKRGSVEEELRRPDPAGGPDWVIRSFEAKEFYGKVPGITSSGYRSPLRRCLQLGRELDGRFGWVDGENVFRPVLTRDDDRSLTRCGSRKLAQTKDMELLLTTMVGHPTRDDRSVLGTVLWGTAGRRLPSLTFAAAGRTDEIEQSASGVYLAFYGPERSPADVVATRRYADGSTKRQTLNPMDMGSIGSAMRARLFPTVKPETHQLGARTSSPSGGPSIGLMVVQSEAGHWCQAETGTIVGDRIGQIQPDLGTMTEQDPSQPSGCVDGEWPPGQAISLGSSFGADPNDGKLSPARGALRLQSGLSMMYGLAREDVDLITFASPRDVRSIVPTGPAHAFIIAWDGDFAASGRVVVTTHLRDGSTRRMTQDLTW